MQQSHKGEQIMDAPPTGGSFQTEWLSDYSYVKILTEKDTFRHIPPSLEHI